MNSKAGRVITAVVYFAVVFLLIAMAAGVFAPARVPGR
jgi:hypothetical protein